MLAGMSLAEGSNLLGKFVEAGTVSGTVKAVSMVDGRARITLVGENGTTQVSMTQVTRVLESDEVELPEEVEETPETEPIP